VLKKITQKIGSAAPLSSEHPDGMSCGWAESEIIRAQGLQEAPEDREATRSDVMYE
jgi:hypothetical protein